MWSIEAAILLLGGLVKVTRIAYSQGLNAGKFAQLAEQARRLGRVRGEVWQRYGSVNGAGVSDRAIRDQWMADGTAEAFGVLANAWKETVRDAVADIAANRAAAKVAVRKAIHQRTLDQAERKRMYTALKVLTDSDGQHHGTELGALLTCESDYRKVKNARRAKIRSVAEKAREAGDHAKADRIVGNNLGTVKRDRRSSRWQQTVRTTTFRAVHAVVDKAALIAAEDLTRTFTGRVRRGRNVNRRLAAWTKGVTAEALASVSERRGSALTLVNAAYTAQVAPCCGVLGQRKGERLHCTRCGVVWQADHAAAINVLHRVGDPDITPRTPYQRVKRIVQQRTDRRPDQTADPGLQLTLWAESEISN
ncbi:zinc ribbon domain-containing protein [Saccharopolyspora elongata]|uniref:zinc ribbon domain-containing protein n=1 Tax=Saccharopolyspora elongata TaxID=2530387 RepID=UPI001A9F41F6|nr:zinc ribbon domain-containing protein [Saccharopolyspora elongata]